MEKFTGPPMHTQLYLVLKEWFLRDFQPEDQLPTEQEIMQRYELGRGTVRAALKELVREGLIERSAGRGSYLAPDYLVRLKRYSVGILLSEREFAGADGWEYSWHNHVEMLNGVMKEALPKNLSLEMIPEGAIGPELNQSFDGFLSFRYIAPGRLALLEKPVIPFHYDLDLAGGLAGMVRHVAESGYRRPAYIGTARAGRIGLINAFLGMNGLEPLSEGAVAECSGTVREGYEACVRLLDRGERPDCLICSTDMRALGVLRCLKERGLRVPEDLGVCGFDGMRESGSSSPSLTTWAFPWQELGTFAVRELRALLDGGPPPRYEPLGGLLVRRESTARREAKPRGAERPGVREVLDELVRPEREGSERRLVFLGEYGLDAAFRVPRSGVSSPVSGGEAAERELVLRGGRLYRARPQEGGGVLLLPAGRSEEADFLQDALGLADGAPGYTVVRDRREGSSAEGLTVLRSKALPLGEAVPAALLWEGTLSAAVLNYPLPALRVSGPEAEPLLKRLRALWEGFRRREECRSLCLYCERAGGLFRGTLVFARSGSAPSAPAGEFSVEAQSLPSAGAEVRGEELFAALRPEGKVFQKEPEELLRFLWEGKEKV